jgi:hypothetical protein
MSKNICSYVLLSKNLFLCLIRFQPANDEKNHEEDTHDDKVPPSEVKRTPNDENSPYSHFFQIHTYLNTSIILFCCKNMESF